MGHKRLKKKKGRKESQPENPRLRGNMSLQLLSARTEAQRVQGWVATRLQRPLRTEPFHSLNVYSRLCLKLSFVSLSYFSL